MLQHVHVLRVEQVGAVLGLFDREVAAGTLLLHDRVLPAAGLGAFAVVAVAAGQVVGEQAAPGERHAHRAVHKAFDVHVLGDVRADVAHGLQIHLPGEHDALGAQLVQGVGGQIVGHAGLRGDVDLQVRGDAPCGHHHADVGDNQRVHAGVLELAQIFLQVLDLGVARQHVAGHIDARAALMGVPGALLEVLQAQVPGRRTHAERLAAAVHGVRPVVHGGFQAAQVACGRQHFGLVAGAHHVFFVHSASQCRRCRRQS